MALTAILLAAVPSASVQSLLELYRDELADIRLNGVYDCDPPGEESVYSNAIDRMRRIKPLLTQRAGAEAIATARADAERIVQETVESVGVPACRIGDAALDKQYLANITGRHESRLQFLEASLGLKQRKDRR